MNKKANLMDTNVRSMRISVRADGEASCNKPAPVSPPHGVTTPHAAGQPCVTANPIRPPYGQMTSQNKVLSAFPAEERRRAELDLQWVNLPVGMMLYEAGIAVKHVYFPTTAIVSLVSSMRDGASAEVAVVGNEGIVGLGAFLGGGRALSSAEVLSAGLALRMSAESLVCLAWRSEPVMHLLLRYAQALFAHMAQASACNRHHSLDQRLCRWLLLNRDRLSGNTMLVTHERIAGVLGVRREGVSVSVLELNKAGLIRCRRGQISVVDHAELEARSCECYAAVRQVYDRLWADPERPSPGFERQRHLPANTLRVGGATG